MSPNGATAASSTENSTGSEARRDAEGGPSRSPGEVLHAALLLAALGLHVFRLKARDKVPDITHGHKDAVSDPRRVTAMFSGHPDANIGIRTGRESGVVVLDVDPRHGGDQSFAKYEKQFGALPLTVTCESGGGGFHYYFQCPEGRLGSRAGCRPGLDVRGDGGYIVAPPSIHPCGRSYRWSEGRAPGEVEFAPLPPALLKLCKSRGQTLEQRGEHYVTRCKPAAEGERNSCAFRIAGHLRALMSVDEGQLDEEKIITLMRAWNARNDPPLEDGELLRCIQNSAKHGTPRSAKREGYSSSAEPSGDCLDAGVPVCGTRGRPTVLIRPGELDDVVSVCIGRLAVEDPPRAFVRGGLVTLVPYVSALPIGNTLVSQRIHELTEPALCDLLNSRNSFLRERRGRSGDVQHQPVNCPSSLAKWMLGRGAWPGMPHLAGIATAPTMLADGEIVAEPGYHRRFGLFLDFAPGQYPPVPTKPTKAEALKALREHILPLYAEFPFVGEEARAVAISGLFTGALRFAFPTAPLHGFDAPMTASGKTLIAEATGVAIQGYAARPISYACSDEEFEKSVESTLMSGVQVALVDNIQREFGGQKLCSAITSTTISVRQYFSQKMVDVPTWGTTWFATGNNLQYDMDAVSRALRCRIDAGVENPAHREFKIQRLREHVLEHRGEIIGAVLTCARAYIVAGSPRQPYKALNRFEGWSDLVRSTLTWLGLADPVATMEAGSDPETEQLAMLLFALREEFGDRTFLAVHAIRSGSLRSTLELVCRHRSGNGFDARILGQILRKGTGRVVGTLRLVLVSKAHGTNKYRVVELGSAGGKGGSGGSDSARPHSMPVDGEPSNTNNKAERSREAGGKGPTAPTPPTGPTNTSGTSRSQPGRGC